MPDFFLIWLANSHIFFPSDTLPLQAPLGPCNKLGTLGLNAEFAIGFIGIKPAVESYKGNIYIPKAVSSKVWFVPKLCFQHLQNFYEFLLGSLLLFSFCAPCLPSTIIDLHYTSYLLVDVVSPKASLCSLVRIRRKQRRFSRPNLIDVLQNNERLTYRLSIVNQYWNLLVNRVHLQKQGTFVLQILLPVLVLNTFFGQSYSSPHAEHAGPEIQQNHLVRHCRIFLKQLKLRRSEEASRFRISKNFNHFSLIFTKNLISYNIFSINSTQTPTTGRVPGLGPNPRSKSRVWVPSSGPSPSLGLGLESGSSFGSESRFGSRFWVPGFRSGSWSRSRSRFGSQVSGLSLGLGSSSGLSRESGFGSRSRVRVRVRVPGLGLSQGLGSGPRSKFGSESRVQVWV
ncbi:hypothetical protein F8388_003974 [Cannabis sativa]|uniref:Uncharacterized protein n=1 Tax=Cannabis sativa TaxID=3483 RepID=A0A7J6GP45_CANSA|nr:hypothetical protein F8388_003974 [Cannabis sativa]